MSERQEKREQFAPAKKRGALLWVVVAAAVVAAAAGAVGWTAAAPKAKYPLVRAEQGRVVLPLAEASDGRAHFYSYKSGAGTVVDFFVLRSRDGVVRAAFDACDVCYRDRKGYRQQGDVMVCNNCDQQFRSDLINEVKGGCNPAPLARSVEGERLVIAAAELERGAKYFQAQQ